MTNAATFVKLEPHDAGRRGTLVVAVGRLHRAYGPRETIGVKAGDGNPLGLPAGPYEIPLVLQDKTFNEDGSLFYPTEGVTDDHPEWVPEFLR